MKGGHLPAGCKEGFVSVFLSRYLHFERQEKAFYFIEYMGASKIKREQEQVRGLCACMCGSKDAEGRGKGDDGRTKTNQRNLQ